MREREADHASPFVNLEEEEKSLLASCSGMKLERKERTTLPRIKCCRGEYNNGSYSRPAEKNDIGDGKWPSSSTLTNTPPYFSTRTRVEM